MEYTFTHWNTNLSQILWEDDRCRVHPPPKKKNYVNSIQGFPGGSEGRESKEMQADYSSYKIVLYDSENFFPFIVPSP